MSIANRQKEFVYIVTAFAGDREDYDWWVVSVHRYEADATARKNVAQRQADTIHGKYQMWLHKWDGDPAKKFRIPISKKERAHPDWNPNRHAHPTYSVDKLPLE